MIAAVITAKSSKEAITDIKKSKDCDLAELRADFIKNLNNHELKKIIKECKKPVIITNRKNDEGGFFSGNENKRIAILKSAIKFGADYIDIECSSDKNIIRDVIKNKKNTKIIISYHNFKETPDNINQIYNNIKKLNPDLIKVVANANSVTDNFKIFELIKTSNKEGKKIVAFCMGSYGQFSRVLSVILGSQITYASVGKGKESASGQLALSEMTDIYRIKKLNKNTKIAGLIGNPVEHSWSHVIHNTGFGKKSVNAVYLKFRVDKLKEFIEYFRNINILGFSVTIPHKIEAIKYLDKLDKKAEAIGAVNTIVAKNNQLIGYNTDCEGAVSALKGKTQLKSKSVVVIGAGGSSRALAYGLNENGADVHILNRTVGKAKSIAEDFDCDYGPLDGLKNIDYDILINTTPIGMHPNSNISPVSPNLIKKESVVFDIVFNPYKTKLLKDAEKRNCTIIPGFEMLVKGAVLQFKLWTCRDAPEQLMRKKIFSYLKNASN